MLHKHGEEQLYNEEKKDLGEKRKEYMTSLSVN